MTSDVDSLRLCATEDQHIRLFGTHGSETSANVIIGRKTGRSKGFGFINMANDGEAENVINALGSADMDSHALTVNEARPRSPCL